MHSDNAPQLCGPLKFIFKVKMAQVADVVDEETDVEDASVTAVSGPVETEQHKLRQGLLN